MIYVSTACLKKTKIKESIEELARNGFKNIELSGGTKYYKEYKKDLLFLRDKYNLNYILHNYFPPPPNDFILNLASLNDDIFKKTLKHYEKSIRLSEELGLKKYGFHAGYYIDFSLEEIGKNISNTEVCNKDKAIKRFCEGYNCLKEKAGNIELYIENNALSYSNIQTFQNIQPFMLTNFNDYLELKEFIDFKLLLDLAHLKVSANSLNIDIDEQLKNLIPISQYIHLSDNDGLHDQHKHILKKSNLINILSKYDFTDKVITLEIYDSLEKLKESFELVQAIVKI